MTRCVFKSVAVVFALFCATAPFSPAWAQASTVTGGDSASPNNGIKFGAGRLHFFADLALHFDSAAGFFAPSGTSALSPELIVHARPGLRLDVPMSWMDLSLGGFIDYLWYTGAVTPGSTTASRLQAGADFKVAFNQNGAVEVQIADTFTRSDRTRNPGIGVGVLSLFNEVSLAVPIHPGGRALEVTPSAAYGIELFSPISTFSVPGCSDISCDPLQVDAGAFNYQNIKASLGARWKFLPKTALLFDTSYDGRSYFTAGVTPPAHLFRVMAGLSGLITSKISATVRAGWGRDFSTSGGASFLAHAEVAWLPTQTSALKLGYQRDIMPVPVYGTLRTDRPYFDGRILLGGAFSVRGYVGYDWMSFFNLSDRVDHGLTVDVGPEYQVTSWFVAAVGYVLNTRTSTLPAASFNFTRHEVYVRASFVY
ncbi:MAG: hypothetical protein ACKVPX_03195 [Myxococcaceae bacterium]